MPWNTWKLLGENYEYHPISFEGAVCYEIAIKRGMVKRVVYVGKAKNARERLGTHGRAGSHIRRKMLFRHSNGWSIYYRFHTHPDADAAEVMEKKRLKKYRYPWNKKGQDRKHRLPLPTPNI